jgi:hypothetical protein
MIGQCKERCGRDAAAAESSSRAPLNMGRVSSRQLDLACRPVRHSSRAPTWSIKVLLVDRRCWLGPEAGGLGPTVKAMGWNLVRPHMFVQRHKTTDDFHPEPTRSLSTPAASRLAIYWRRRAIQASSHGAPPRPTLQNSQSPFPSQTQLVSAALPRKPRASSRTLPTVASRGPAGQTGRQPAGRLHKF